MSVRLSRLAALAALGFFALGLGAAASAQEALVRRAPEVAMPRAVDSNSPAFWRDGRLFWFSSSGGPALSAGPDQFGPWEPKPTRMVNAIDQPHWLESVWSDDDRTLWGWYHAEPIGLVPGTTLTAPNIGAVISTDDGATLRDLGVVLASGDPIDPAARNGYFAGGHGDFSVIHDRQRQYFYFFFDNYAGAAATQGVCLARMAFEDRKNPAGKVWKYHNGAWREAGVGGRVTPIFPVKKAWQAADPDALWGPSVHWNTYLNCFVMLLSHAAGEPGWSQQGIWVSFCADLSKPETWSTPRQILDKAGFPGWYFFYPQVMGLERGGTDTLAGQIARLYVGGLSRWEIEFVAPAIAPAALALAGAPAGAVAAGASVTLSVSGMGQPPFTYQWHKEGAPIPGATAATLTIAAATPADAGAYSVVVANALGSATSRSVTVAVEAPPPPPPMAFLVNLSIHAHLIDAGASHLLGYSVRGAAPKPIVVRALGPSLARLGVAGSVEDPRLELLDAAGVRLAENDDWLAADAAAFAAAGAFALPEGSTDAAVALAVPPGSGTARARATDSGALLVELYDPQPSEASRIDDMAVRGRVSFGSRAMAGGFSVGGTGTVRVLIRALGPHLAQFGVAQPLADPLLQVFGQDGEKIAENDDWDAALAPVFVAAGASPLEEGSRDAAVVVTVLAGRSYTLAVRRDDGAGREAMLELHALR